MPEGHSPVGASGMHRWKRCAGSVELCKTVPDIQTWEGAEGTAAHEIAHLILTTSDRILSEDCALPVRIKVGQHDIEITKEMIDYVFEYAQTVVDDMVKYTGSTGKSEITFWLKQVDPDAWGTADYVLTCPDHDLLIVYDLKYGAGEEVEVEDNDQLKYYALGAVMAQQYTGKWVEMVICQPRLPVKGETVRRHRYKTSELADFALELKAAIEATRQADAPRTPGRIQCRWCQAAGICPELREASQQLAKTEFSMIVNMPPEKLAEILTKIDMVEQWVKKVREYAYSEAQHGRPLPGFKLVARQPRRKWDKDADYTTDMLEQCTSVNRSELFEIAKLKSPAQVEKVLPKEERAIVGKLATPISSGTVLVPESDKRPALLTGPKADFADTTDGTDVTDIGEYENGKAKT